MGLTLLSDRKESLAPITTTYRTSILLENSNGTDIILRMENDVIQPENPFQSRLAALQKRVNEAALALHREGVRPTVARIRAALGGGSPNDLTPALRHWKTEVLPTLEPSSAGEGGTPPQVADLMRELWTRALAAASIDKRGGDAALQLVARSEEAGALRDQITALRNQLEREALAYGELRAQSARHEAIAKDALGRIREIEERERKALYQLGEAKQRIAALEAKADQSIARPQVPARPSARRPAQIARRTARPNLKTRRAGRPDKKSTKAPPRRKAHKRH
jgi:hypothetical protein